MRALVLSGGGALGAFQVGVLKYLMADLGKNYKIYCGVSVGAINCAHLAMFEGGKEAAQSLEEMWRDFNDSDIKKRWFPFGKLHALWKSSLYDTQPLIDMIHLKLDAERIIKAGNKLRVGAVSLNTGEYKLFDEKFSNVADAVLASAAFPAMFRPIMIDGELYIDGGVRTTTPLKSAIDLGATEIDVILTSPVGLPVGFKENAKTIDIGMRTISIMSDEVMENDLEVALLINKLVASKSISNKKIIDINIIRPDKLLVENALNFVKEEIAEMIDYGYKIVKTA